LEDILTRCSNCNEEAYIYENKGKCPTCGKILEMHGQFNDGKNNNIKINLDYNYISCDCGNTLHYNEIVCDKCGQEQNITKDNMDPNVELRKEKFKDVLDLINATDISIKKLRRELSKSDIKKILYEDFFTILQFKIDEICKLTNKKIFEDLSFVTEVISTQETKDKIVEIKVHIDDFYKIYIDLLMIEVPYMWENSYRRICNAVRSYLDSYKLIIISIVSETINEAFCNNELAQQKMDSASEELEIFSDIINIKDLEMNFELIEEGNINTPVIMLMMMGGSKKYNLIGEEFNDLQFSTYKYFKDFLPYEFEYYTSLKQPILIKLSSYKLLSMTTFLEYKFIEKVKIVNSLLIRANETNLPELKKFIGEFKLKYIYALKIVNDVAQDCILNFSYCKNEKMLIRNAMKWYKDLSEGVYRDISSLIIACTNIINKKNLDYEYILEWMGFPDKLDFLESNKKLRLNKLAEGVEKILRHSEAHVDFEIDDINKVILVRNKVNRTKVINEITYTYEEFYKAQIELQETIFSMIAGIELFISNNYNDYEFFSSEVEKELSDIYEVNMLEYTFPLVGIVDIKESYDDDKRTLTIKGCSIDRKDRDLLERVIACVSPIITKRTEIDTIIIKLVDDENKAIGIVEITTKYMKRFFQIDSKYKKYESLLIFMSRKIEYSYNDYIEETDIYGFKTILAIIQWCMDLIKTLNELNHKDNYVKNLKDIKDELNYSIKTINEGMFFVENKRLLEYAIKIISGFINGIDRDIEGKIRDSLINNLKSKSLYQKVCNQSAEIFGTLGEEEKITALLDNTEHINNHIKVKVGRNESCPCGSGKKYKKCCGK